MATIIRLNHAGMSALLKSDDVRALLTPRAERVLAAAQADPHDETYEYERSLHIEQHTTDRAVTRVVASDRKAHILEAKYGILARALDHGGGE